MVLYLLNYSYITYLIEDVSPNRPIEFILSIQISSIFISKSNRQLVNVCRLL
jgi:hypothetical protein